MTSRFIENGVMYKYVSAALAILLATCSVTIAKPSPKVFQGAYQGIATLQNITGSYLFYTPIRIRVAKNGKITGTAYQTTTQQILQVRGKIRNVSVRYKTLFSGKATGTFSDGASWKAVFSASTYSSDKSGSGTCAFGDYLGDFVVTHK